MQPTTTKKHQKTPNRTERFALNRYRTKGWPPERRARQAANIRRTRPWAFSTGPRTEAGKEKSSLNARKHGLYSSIGRELCAFLREHRRFITAYRAALRTGAWELYFPGGRWIMTPKNRAILQPAASPLTIGPLFKRICVP